MHHASHSSQSHSCSCIAKTWTAWKTVRWVNRLALRTARRVSAQSHPPSQTERPVTGASVGPPERENDREAFGETLSLTFGPLDPEPFDWASFNLLPAMGGLFLVRQVDLFEIYLYIFAYIFTHAHTHMRFYMCKLTSVKILYTYIYIYICKVFVYTYVSVHSKLTH